VNLEQTFNEYKNIEMKMKDFEHKIIMLTQEIERLNQLINEKNVLINNLERDQLDLHSKINHYKSYEQKIQ
jgi:prefoldin subunit 5